MANEELDRYPIRYSYSALQPIESVRVIELEPSPNLSDDLRCKLTACPLENADNMYEAISYACGDYKPSVGLVIDSSRHLLITKHLAAALRRFRYPDKTRNLWADAICIDQFNDDEKASQVALMRDIYPKAATVLVWLGEEDEDTDTAYSLCKNIALDHAAYGIKEMYPYHGRQAYTQAEQSKRVALMSNTSAGKCLASLLTLPYFGRRWIVQELVLAKSAIIIRGSFAPEWRVFALALAVMRSFLGSIHVNWMYIGGSKLACWEYPWRILSIREPRITIKAAPTHFLRHDHPEFESLKLVFSKMRSRLTTVELLGAYDGTVTRDPRDMIYSLLGMAEEDIGFRPDYRESTDETYVRFAQKKLVQDQEIRILHHVRGTESPSYAPDWRLPSETALLGGRGSCRFSSGLHKDTRISLTVDNGLVISSRFIDKIQSVQPQARRFSPTTVESTSPPTHPALEFFWDCLSGYTRTAENKPKYYASSTEIWLSALARTLCCDNRLPDQWKVLAKSTETSFYHHIVVRILMLYKNNIDEPQETRKSLNQQHTVNLDNEILSYLNACLPTMVGRSFIVTRNGFFGLAPQHVQEGDVVTILDGGETPFVLRPVSCSESLGNEKYRLLGECYVHGFMYCQNVKLGEESRFQYHLV